VISIIHPSRGRPQQSFETMSRWLKLASDPNQVEIIVSLDENDPSLRDYFNFYDCHFKTFKHTKIILPNKSSVEAINNAAKIANGSIFMVVGDDQYCCPSWDARILNYTAKKTDWVLKVRDGLQNKIITLPIFDRTYYSRDKYVYHPNFKHLFSDTWFSDLAYARKRVIVKNVRFPHRQYSIIGTEPDEINLKNNATYESGKKTYLELKKNIAMYV
jgi:hypothetical protein